MRAKIYLCFALMLFAGMAWAQVSTISGKITDSESGEPLPGVNVIIKNTMQGTVTDIDGNYTIQASPEDMLVFSFIGYLSEEVPVGAQTTINFSLMPNIETLSELVVVGYGVQKKSVVTGAISSIKASDLETLPLNSVSQTLQGRVSGLTIASNSGQPGEGATIRVRGITTLNNNDPLWVVDGVVVDNGGIGYLNQSDIASIEVLKDAASQAIYGTRAAAGVILITTKSGQPGKLRVNYNGYYGTSAPARKLDLLNATEYATLRNEAAVADGKSIIYADPATLGKGTDWQDQIFNNDARRQNHELSLSGGNDISTFYLSFGYLDQEGIVASDISNYERYNFRLNSTHKIAKWLTVGENIGYAHNKSIGLGNTNSEFGGPLSSAINLDPITPVVVTDPAVAAGSPYADNPVFRDAMGRPYGISSAVGQEMSNPLAYMKTRDGNYGWGDNIVGNMFAEAKPIEGLVLRSTVGFKLAYWGDKSFTPIYYLAATQKNDVTRYFNSVNRRFDWNVENTISYSTTIEDHNFTILLGQGAYQDNFSNGINVTKSGLPVGSFDDASMNYNIPSDDRDGNGYENAPHNVSSLFARLNYDFDEKYLLTAVVRRDGSSRFGSNNKYGFFPSGSVGWVVSREGFWPSNNVVNFLKVRGGYGVVGNDNINDFMYLATISGGRDYTIGTGNASSPGYSPNAPSNPDLRWEETSQLNIGFEATILRDLTLTVDWYKKETTGILRRDPMPWHGGYINDPFANIGDMENKGVELELGYNKRIGDLEFSLTGNVSYLENKVTNLGDVEYYNTSSFQNMGNMARMAVGKPIDSFFGYSRLGVFQTQEDIQNHQNSEGQIIQPDAKPGDFIWADLNDDGQINDEDRTFLGSPIPDWSYGINLTASYKGFDLLVFGQGAAGNQIFQGLRRLDITNANWQTKALGRWTGAGTSNDFPRLSNDDKNENFKKASDFYIEDGDYFRIKVVQLGYSLPQSIIEKAGLSKARIYLMGENLFTFTQYSGYDPEIGGGSFGIDRGIYPQARSFMIGANLTF